MNKKNYTRLLQPPDFSFFLFGARGVGKSTWARDRYGDAFRVDLLDEGLYQSLLADPSLFAGMLRALPDGAWVVLDEIQRLPNLLNEVHRFIEEREMHFVLLGSSARKLKTAGTNLLAGRALWKTMFPLLPAELGDDFALNRVLQFGSIPLIWNARDPRGALKAYVQLYLREEIKAEAQVRNLPGFVRFLPIAGLFHAQALNVSAIGRDAGAARTTVAGYLELLEDTLLATRLPAFDGRLRVRERKHPKLYWVDPGLARAVTKQLGPVTIHERGPLLEGWVHTLLRAYAEENELYDELFYWSPSQAKQTEVDFLLRRGNEFLALEVKSSERFARPMLSGLLAIADLQRVVRRLVIYGGERVLETPEGIEVWPIPHFLRELASHRLWP